MTAPLSTSGAPGSAPQPKQHGTGRVELGEGWISGNVTQDVEYRFTNTGRQLANIRVAYSPRIKDPITGEWTEAETEFYTLTAWGALAERCAELLQVGDRIIAGGVFVRESWEDRDGKPREAVKMTVRDLGASMQFTGVRIDRRRKPGRHRPSNTAAPELPPPPDEPPF